MCTLITSKGTDINENNANQNHATRTRSPKQGYINLSNTVCPPVSAFDADWQPEILSPIARLPARLYYSALFVEKVRAFRILVLECFHNQKPPTQCIQLVMRQVNKRGKNNYGKEKNWNSWSGYIFKWISTLPSCPVASTP
jgi:hypothetical protein